MGHWLVESKILFREINFFFVSSKFRFFPFLSFNSLTWTFHFWSTENHIPDMRPDFPSQYVDPLRCKSVNRFCTGNRPFPLWADWHRIPDMRSIHAENHLLHLWCRAVLSGRWLRFSWCTWHRFDCDVPVALTWLHRWRLTFADQHDGIRWRSRWGLEQCLRRRKKIGFFDHRRVEMSNLRVGNCDMFDATWTNSLAASKWLPIFTWTRTNVYRCRRAKLFFRSEATLKLLRRNSCGN